MFTFDWTVNISSLIGTIIFIGTLIGMWYAVKLDVRLLKYDVHAIKEQQRITNEAFNQLGAILTQVAVQDTRLSMMEKNIDELRHGQGFVKERTTS